MSINEQRRAAIKRLAEVADGSAAPANVTDYVAEFHDSLADTIIVWAPCGCSLIMDKFGEQLWTCCTKPECAFVWAQALDAIRALKLAVQPVENTELALVTLPKEATVDPNLQILQEAPQQ
jgi:hypothetical protein